MRRGTVGGSGRCVIRTVEGSDASALAGATLSQRRGLLRQLVPTGPRQRRLMA